MASCPWSPCSPAPGERSPARTAPSMFRVPEPGYPLERSSHGRDPVRLRKPFGHLPHHATAAPSGRPAAGAGPRRRLPGGAHPASRGVARGRCRSPGRRRGHGSVRPGGRSGDRHPRLQGRLLRVAEVAARPAPAVRADRQDGAAARHRRQHRPRPGHRLRPAPGSELHGRGAHRPGLVHARQGPHRGGTTAGWWSRRAPPPPWPRSRTGSPRSWAVVRRH